MLTCPTMVPVLEAILKSQTVQSDDGSALPLHSAIGSEEGELLQKLVMELQPAVTLEVGLAYGISALFICEALSRIDGARHIVIDPGQYSSWGGIGLANLEKAGFHSLVDFRCSESQIVLPQLAAQGVQIDFAFIDGFHTFDHTLVDFFFVDKMLKPGGVVVFDDANWPGIHKVCKFIATNRGYRVRAALGGSKPTIGTRLLTLLAKRVSPLQRMLRHKFSEPDEQFGFSWNSEMMAFEKLEHDQRNWDFDRDF